MAKDDVTSNMPRSGEGMGISKHEYRDRVRKLAELSGREGFEAVLLTGESNIEYFSGFRHHAPWTLFARPFFQIITADGRSVLLTHRFLEPEMRRTSAIDDIRLYSQSGNAPVELLKDILNQFGIRRGRLGMELGCEQRLGISLLDFRRLEMELTDLSTADASDAIWRLRMIKSPAERQLMRRSAEITAKAFDECFKTARPGMSEEDVARVAAETMVTNGAERPGFILIASGRENYHILSGKPTQRRLEKGDMLWMDMAAVYRGYWSDFCRAAYFGNPSPEIEERQKLILDVNQAAIAAVANGARVRDIAAAAVRAFRNHGIEISLGLNRIGHGMGLMSTEPPHVALYDETICEEGLAFTIEPRIVSTEGIFNCEELIFVTATGAEVVRSAPRNITYIT